MVNIHKKQKIAEQIIKLVKNCESIELFTDEDESGWIEIDGVMFIFNSNKEIKEITMNL